jgi:hypothetical protein
VPSFSYWRSIGFKALSKPRFLETWSYVFSPAFAFVVVSCGPPSRLTTLQVEVTTFSQHTRSVQRASGFVVCRACSAVWR